MRKTFSFVLCCFVLNLLVTVTANADDVKTTVVRVSETRTKTLVKKKNIFGDSTTLQLTVKLKGADVKKATKYGKIEIDKAEDNLGNSLVKSGRFAFGGDRLQALDRNRFGFGFGNEKPPKDEVEIDLNMKAGNRNATSIAVLEGSLILGIVTTENVTLSVEELKKLVGKKIQNATLKKMGIHIVVKSFQTNSGVYIELEVTGKTDLVPDAKFEDAKGKKFNTGHTSFGFNKKRTIQLNGSKPLPKGAKLVIPIETSLKEIVVKFRFTDIPLP